MDVHCKKKIGIWVEKHICKAHKSLVNSYWIQSQNWLALIQLVYYSITEKK